MNEAVQHIKEAINAVTTAVEDAMRQLIVEGYGVTEEIKTLSERLRANVATQDEIIRVIGEALGYAEDCLDEAYEANEYFHMVAELFASDKIPSKTEDEDESEITNDEE